VALGKASSHFAMNIVSWHGLYSMSNM